VHCAVQKGKWIGLFNWELAGGERWWTEKNKEFVVFVSGVSYLRFNYGLVLDLVFG